MPLTDVDVGQHVASSFETKERKGARSSWSQLLSQASTLKVIYCRKIGLHHVLRVACNHIKLVGGALASEGEGEPGRTRSR